MGVLAQLSEVYLKTNRAADAERVAKRAVTFNKTEPLALMTLGSIYAAEQTLRRRARTVRAGLQLSTRRTRRRSIQIATTYAQQNNIPMALQTINRALMIDPKSVQALVYKADLYAKQHDDAQASAAYDDAIVAAASDDQKAQIMVRKAAYFFGEKKNAQGEAILAASDDAISQGRRAVRRLRRLLRVAASVGQSRRQSSKPRWRSIPTTPARCLGLGEISMQSGQVTDSIALLETLHASLARRAGLRAARASLFAGARLRQSARLVRQELRDPAIARNAQLRRRCRLRTEELQRSGADLRRARPQRSRISRSKIRRCSTSPPNRTKAANQCQKAAATYKRLLPMMKKGTKDYANVQKSAIRLHAREI